jgi:hypothetical protein
MSSTASSFFGDDWDDDDLPTLVRTPSMLDAEETLEQRPANDLSGANKHPVSGFWVKREDAVDVAIPLVVRWVDPFAIIEEMQRDPQPVIPVPNNTMDVLPWDVEVVEDSVALQQMLQPPTWYAPMPVHPIRTSKPIPNSVLFAAALVLGFACSALGCIAVLAMFSP